jgi:site-specific recombinase XerD
MGKIADKMRTDLVLRGFAATTVSRYLALTHRFVEWTGKPPGRIVEDDVRAYLRTLLEERKIAPNGARVHIAAIKFLFRVTLERPHIVARIPWPKQPKILPEVPSPEEVRILLNAAPSTQTASMLMLAYGAGLRLSEVQALRAGDIDSKRRVIHVRAGKGKKDRITILPPFLLATLRSWWRVRCGRGDHIFPGRSGKGLSKTLIARRFREALGHSGLNRPMTLHSLRAAFATHLLENGVDVVTIQALLGHAQLSTTLRYLRLRAVHIENVRSPLERLYAVNKAAAAK